MRVLVGIVTALLLSIVACSSGPGGGLCDALVSNCDSSAKTCKRLLDADALDHPTCVEKRDAFLGCLANQKIACPDSSTIYAGAGEMGAKFSLNGFTAYTNATCTGLGDKWVACRDMKPPCTLVSVGASKTIALSPSSPMATAPTANLVAPGSGSHTWDTKYDVDTSAFIGSGTLTISGTMGATGSEGSFDLFPACMKLPTGDVTGQLADAHNVSAGSMWEMSYFFERGAVFHFAGEGSWNSTKGMTNTSTVTLKVMQ